MTGWWLLATGCPWIPFSEHFSEDPTDRPHDLPKDAATADAPEGDTDAGTDRGPDADTGGPPDTGPTEPPPTGETTDTQPYCFDDPSLVPLGLPIEIASEVCPGSEERFWVDVLPYASLVIQLQDIDCADPGLMVDILEPDGTRAAWLDSWWVCSSLTLTTSHQQYEVVVRSQSDDALPYGLSLGFDNCADFDEDGHTDPDCGGDDCDDGDPAVFPGAAEVAGNGVDEDCDGGDELPVCPVAPFYTYLDGIEALPCADLTTGAAWDRWLVPSVLAGSQLTVTLLNNDDGAADLLAFVVGPDGTSHYGLDGAQLNDETNCPVTPWTGGGCPLQCLEIDDAGDVEVWVAQVPGTGCVDGAEYALIVFDNLGPGLVLLQDDDVPLDWP